MRFYTRRGWTAALCLMGCAETVNRTDVGDTTDADASTSSPTTAVSTFLDTGPITGEESTGSDTSDGGADPSSSSTGALAALSHALDIQPLWDRSCAATACHDGTRPPNLSAAKAYNEIVDVTVPMHDGLTYIEPGDFYNSYIWRKIVGLPNIGGARMPITGSWLPKAEVDLLQQWIAEGALP